MTPRQRKQAISVLASIMTAIAVLLVVNGWRPHDGRQAVPASPAYASNITELNSVDVSSDDLNSTVPICATVVAAKGDTLKVSFVRRRMTNKHRSGYAVFAQHVFKSHGGDRVCTTYKSPQTVGMERVAVRVFDATSASNGLPATSSFLIVPRPPNP